MVVMKGSLDELVSMIDAGEAISFCYADMRFRKDTGETWVWVASCPVCGKQHRYPAQKEQIDEEWIIARVAALCDNSKEIVLIKKSWKRRLATVGAITKRKPISSRVKRMVFRKTEGRCWYCGEQLLRHGLFYGEIDHVRPIALGGDNDPGNLVAACGPCNAAKGDKPLATFRALRGGDLFWFERWEGGWAA